MIVLGKLYRMLFRFVYLLVPRSFRSRLPVTDKGLRIYKCGFKPKVLVTVQLTHITSPRYRNPGRYVNTIGVMADENGCIDYVWEQLGTTCSDDPGATIEIKFSQLNRPFSGGKLYDCGGWRVG